MEIIIKINRFYIKREYQKLKSFKKFINLSITKVLRDLIDQ